MVNVNAPDLDTLRVNVRRHFCNKILERYQARHTHAQPTATPENASNSIPSQDDFGTGSITRVAIIGAGVAGLHSAMILGEFYDVDVYEADERVGGRLYTHHFGSNVEDSEETDGKYNYFDVGAMRFPDTKLMEQTFKLFKRLDIPLLDYHPFDENTWLAFNGQRFRRKYMNTETWNRDPFKFVSAHGGSIPDSWLSKDPSAHLRDALRPFIVKLVEDCDSGLDYLSLFDNHSTRSYLIFEKKYPPAVVDYLEIMCFDTGTFDRGLAGGSSVLPRRMVETLDRDYPRVRIHTRHRVGNVRYELATDFHKPQDERLVVGGTAGEAASTGLVTFSRRYSNVVFAIPPPCVRMIDTSTCRLDAEQRKALREVRIGASSKIGVKFETAWWTKEGIRGGESLTDRLVRHVVYPSHGDGESKVLIVSYAVDHDATFLSPFIRGRGSQEESNLKELIITDLASIHNIETEFLRDQFEDMYAFDWASSPNAMGAFGMFGPSQFEQLYCALTRPAADGHVHFIGEALSTNHSWVVGALESAERGVYQMLALAHLDHHTTFSTPNLDQGAISDLRRRLENLDPGVDRSYALEQLLVSKKLQGGERIC